jgi:4-hydroxy-tetrahydrodipicolinate synthase
MFKGTFTAIITPFKKDLSLDEDALRKLVEFQIENGVDGLVPCGTTGESPTTTSEEDKRIFEIVIDQVKGRVPVIAGSGSNSTTEAVAYTQHAKDSGAQASLIVCPYYNKPTQKGLILHYTKIAEETKFPIIIYNIKGRTGINMTTDTLMELAKNPYIVGVKEASGDMVQIKEVLSRRPQNFTVLSGDDGLTLEVIKNGGNGVISVASNALPRAVSTLVKNALEGKISEAEKENEALKEFFEKEFIETNPIPIKTALAAMGMCEEIFRLPLCTMEEKTRAAWMETLKKYQLIK